jgi:hypothetical protein
VTDAEVLGYLGEWVSASEILAMANTGKIWRMSSGSLYTTLYRLESEGRVESRWIEGPYPRTRVYRARRYDER